MSHISKYKPVVFFFAIFTVVIAFLNVGNISKDVYPEFALPHIEVQTEALGLSAEEVQNLVTVNLEEMLFSTPWLDSIESKSTLGISSITLRFKPDTDLVQARQLVQENLALAYLLPNVSKPPVILQPTSSTNRIMMIGLTSETVSNIDISILARWNVLPTLLSVPGVANVSIWGYEDRQLQVSVDPKRLVSNNITLNQIIETAGDTLWVSPLSFLAASTAGTGGWIDTPNQRLGVLHLFPISTPEDLDKVPVAQGGGILLGDITETEVNHQPLIGSASINNQDGIILLVEKFPNSDVVSVTEDLEDKLGSLGLGLEGIDISTETFRHASFVENIFNDFYTISLIVLILIFAFLAFFYRPRLALIGVLPIALTFLVTLLALYLLEFTLNIMVMFAFIGVLIIILQSVVFLLESIKKCLEKGTGDELNKVINLNSKKELPFIFIAILLAVPFLFINNELGLFLFPFFITYILTLVVYAIISRLFTPYLVDSVLSEMRDLNFRQDIFTKAYKDFFKKLINIKYILIVVAIIVAIVVGGTLSILKSDIAIPAPKDPNIVIEFEGETGASLPNTIDSVSKITEELIKLEGVKNVSSTSGRAIMGDLVVGIHSSQIWVITDSAKDTIEEIKNVVASYPKFDTQVRSYSQKISDKILSKKEDLFVRVYGPSISEVQEQALELKEHLLDSVEDPLSLNVLNKEQRPRIEIEVDLDKAKLYGIKPGDVRRAAATLINGLVVGYFFEDEKVYEVIVWGDPEIRQDINSVKDILIDIPSGGGIPLGSVADVRIGSTQDIIHREGFSSFIDIEVGVEDGFSRSDVIESISGSIKEYDYPVEYRAILIDTKEKNKENLIFLLVSVLSVLIFIYLLLQYLLGSWRLAFLTFLMLPLSLSGGIIAVVFVNDSVVSLGSLVGFLTIFAIAIRNGLLLISHYRQLEEKEGEPWGMPLIIRGALERFSPIMMTALATGLALVPLIIAGNIPGHEIEYPMAIVILGGLVTSTLLNLFVLPFLYFKFAGKKSMNENNRLS